MPHNDLANFKCHSGQSPLPQRVFVQSRAPARIWLLRPETRKSGRDLDCPAKAIPRTTGGVGSGRTVRIEILLLHAAVGAIDREADRINDGHGCYGTTVGGFWPVVFNPAAGVNLGSLAAILTDNGFRHHDRPRRCGAVHNARYYVHIAYQKSTTRGDKVRRSERRPPYITSAGLKETNDAYFLSSCF